MSYHPTLTSGTSNSFSSTHIFNSSTERIYDQMLLFQKFTPCICSIIYGKKKAFCVNPKFRSQSHIVIYIFGDIYGTIIIDIIPQDNFHGFLSSYFVSSFSNLPWTERTSNITRYIPNKVSVYGCFFKLSIS